MPTSPTSSPRPADAPIGVTTEELREIEEKVPAGRQPRIQSLLQGQRRHERGLDQHQARTKRDASDDPFELSVDINRIDSGRSWTKPAANTLYGWYTGLAYLLRSSAAGSPTS